MKGLKKLQKNVITVVLAMGMLLLAGCGSSSKSYSMDTAPMEYSAATNGSAMEYAVEAEAPGALKVEAKPVEEAGATDAADVDVAATDRKLIKTVDMEVETREFDNLMSTIESQVKALGGYIENMNTYNGSSYYDGRGTRNADITIRIPKEQLDGFLNTVSGASNVIRRSENVEDVTLSYVDLESHRDALRTEQTRLLELLEKAESIEDIITIEQRLSDVRYQLESMESQLRTYDNQVDYSTVYLYIDEVEVFTPVEEETAWERISYGFMESIEDIVDSIKEFCISFVINIPYMVVWVIIVGAMILVFALFIKWVNRKAEKSRKQAEARAKEQTQKTEDTHE